VEFSTFVQWIESGPVLGQRSGGSNQTIHEIPV
jgi:hypothetical protein